MDILTNKMTIEEKRLYNTLELIPILDGLLVTLLESLTPDQWLTPTIAGKWRVKDVVAHLIDGNLRNLSIARDHYNEPSPHPITGFDTLVQFINELNHTWTDAAGRLSPQILLWLLKASNQQYFEHLSSLEPDQPAIFPVAWAGHSTSPNWFHIAREYTEKFLHHQQIRDALNIPGIMTSQLFRPFMAVSMYALPEAFKDITVPENTLVSVNILSEIGGTWSICYKDNAWQMVTDSNIDAHTVVDIPPEIAWKLFSKSLAPQDAVPYIQISGDQQLGQHVLNMTSVMASNKKFF